MEALFQAYIFEKHKENLFLLRKTETMEDL